MPERGVSITACMNCATKAVFMPLGGELMSRLCLQTLYNTFEQLEVRGGEIVAGAHVRHTGLVSLCCGR